MCFYNRKPSQISPHALNEAMGFAKLLPQNAGPTANFFNKFFYHNKKLFYENH